MVRKGFPRPGAQGAFEGFPGELAEFLSKDTYSLLIKGEPGTGKTILALSILKALGPIENLLYLSTRASPRQLVRNFPWAEGVFGGVGLPDRGGPPDSEGWERLVDARLDEPSVIFERITNVLMDKHAPTVVIDSWESMADSLGAEALRTDIRVLQTWRERAGARFIFVGDEPANSDLDFMVEGVLLLKDRVAEGRRMREATLSKLYGVRISRPSYFFTLQGGVFTSFPAYVPRDYSFRSPPRPGVRMPYRRTRSRFPTGYAVLDEQLDGGYPAGSTVLVEVGPRVDLRVGLVFLSRILQGWVSMGGGVTVEKIRGVDARYALRWAQSFVRRGRVELRPPGSPRERRAKSLCIVDGSAGRRGGTRRPQLTVALARSTEADPELVRTADVHIRILDVEGTLFVESEVPWSAVFGVTQTATSGTTMMELEPIV